MPPWSGPDVNDLVPSATGAPASIRFGFELARITGGNPALVQAYIDELGRLPAEEREAVISGARRLIDLQPPEQARQMVEARTASLEGVRRRTLQALAILDMFVDVEMLSAVASMEVVSVEEALDDLEEAGLVRARPTVDGVVFSVASPVAARVIALGAPSMLAQRIRARASELLLGRDDITPGQVITRAFHHASVRPMGPERAREVLDAANVLLARGRNLVARDLARTVASEAIEHDLEPEILASSAEVLARTLRRAGDAVAAERLVDAMKPRGLADQPPYFVALLDLARGWLSSGRELEAEAALRHLVVHPRISADVHVDATAELVRLHHWNGRPDRAVDLAVVGRERHAGNDHAVARLWLQQSLVSEMAGHPDQARREAWEALRHGRRSDDFATVARAMSTIGEGWLDSDSADRAVRWIRGAVARAESRQLVADAAWIRNRLIPAYIEAGDWMTADLSAQRALGQAASLNLAYTRRRNESAAALVNALRGRPSAAWLRTRVTATDFGNPLVLVAVTVALFEQQQLAGQHEHAYLTLALTAEALESRPGWERLAALDILPRLARCLHERGDVPGLRDVVQRLGTIASSRPSLRVAQTEFLLAQGRLDLLEARAAEAVRRIDEARTRYREQEYRWRWADSAGLAAEARARTDRVADAVQILQAGIRELDALGAAPSAALQRAQIHALGAAAPRVRRGEGELTQRQAEVARLAAEGFSDRQIAAELGISLRTTTTHMHAILRRLELHSRSDLAAYFDRDGGGRQLR
ncbi:MAG: response regulator transcription factor [Dehalococcoidia bacterium]|nr:response regulator transcription factor [Dehalococcoidia bacterium]